MDPSRIHCVSVADMVLLSDTENAIEALHVEDTDRTLLIRGDGPWFAAALEGGLSGKLSC